MDSLRIEVPVLFDAAALIPKATHQIRAVGATATVERMADFKQSHTESE